MFTKIKNSTPSFRICWWFGFFVEWHINVCRLFNAKAIHLEELQWCYLTHSWEDKRVHTFPKSICPKVNVIARLEYELAYYDCVVHRFNHYTTRTPPGSVENTQEVVKNQLNPVSVEDFQHCFRGEEKLLLHVCVASQEKYFEGDKVNLSLLGWVKSFAIFW